MPDTAPLSKTFYTDALALATAVSDEVSAFVAPFNCTVTSVTYMANAGITGANTNTRRISLVNKGMTGVGTTEIAGLQFNAGVNAAAFDEVTVPLHATAANRDADEGAVIAFVSNAVGTGLADPGGVVKVVVNRR